MGNLAIKKENIIYQADMPVTELTCIIKGSVKADNENTEIMLYAGDVIGIVDINRSHSFTYQAQEDCVLVTYAVEGENDIEKLLRDNSTLAKCVLNSSVRQTCMLAESYRNRLKANSSLYELLHNGYHDYKSMCKALLIPAKTLPELINDSDGSDMIPLFDKNEEIDYLLTRYDEFKDMLQKHLLEGFAGYAVFVTEIVSGVVRDFFLMLLELNHISEYENELSVLLLNENHLDLFDIYTSLYYHYIKMGDSNAFLEAKITQFEEKIAASSYIDSELAKLRIAEHHEKKDKLREEKEKGGVLKEESSEYYKKFHHSLDTILQYADCTVELENEFRKAVNDFKRVNDRNSSDTAVRELRHRLTGLFYEVYAAAFKNSLTDDEIPVVLKMFFNFGYVDEELAGMENAICLYSIAEYFSGKPEYHVYTAYEWLLAVYRGMKMPRRNEYDVDYQEFVHEQFLNKSISKKEEKELLEDSEEKLKFELQNFFPAVNKMTFGRISTFCPVFSENNVITDLKRSLVTPELVMDTIQNIRQIDYSAFYREVLFYDGDSNVREVIQVEYLPDVILMPNVGSRGVMWQEIEGKHRSSRATFALPVFLLENMENIIVRITGEYRFEMCKRAQGARWNDVSEPSLTSEYCDYVQFYRKNNELSANHKEQIKSALLKARNSYKQMFAQDYLAWIIYEGKGAPRLNKVSRRILFTYCPFREEIRNRNADNPLYRDLIARFEVQKGQALTRLNNLLKKLDNAGKYIPEELYAQQEFLEM